MIQKTTRSPNRDVVDAVDLAEDKEVVREDSSEVLDVEDREARNVNVADHYMKM